MNNGGKCFLCHPWFYTFGGVMCQDIHTKNNFCVSLCVPSFVSEFKKAAPHRFHKKVGILLTDSTIRFAVHHKVRGNAKPFAYLKP